MLAYRYDGNGIYKGEATCQRDPLESDKAGYDIWLLPAECTWTAPLEEKEGFDRKYNKESDSWEYVEKKKDPEPTEYVPTEKEKLQNELFEYENKLRELDYIGIKLATGRAKKADYADEIALMSEYAAKVDELREQIAALEAEEEVDETPAE